MPGKNDAAESYMSPGFVAEGPGMFSARGVMATRLMLRTPFE